MAIPQYVFSPGTTIESAKANANWAQMALMVLRTGDTFTGTMNTQHMLAVTANTYDLGSVAKYFRSLFTKAAKLIDTGNDHVMSLVLNEDLSADRILNIVLGNASRTLTIAGDSSVNGTFSGTHSGTSSGANTGDQTLPTRDSLGIDTDDTVTFAQLILSGLATLATVLTSGDITIAKTIPAMVFYDTTGSPDERRSYWVQTASLSQWVSQNDDLTTRFVFARGGNATGVVDFPQGLQSGGNSVLSDADAGTFDDVTVGDGSGGTKTLHFNSKGMYTGVS